MDKTEITITSYNKNARSFEAKFMDLKLYKQSFDCLFSYIRDNNTVLDLGCGPGNAAKYLIDRNKTLTITGVDLSSEMISLAESNVPDATFVLHDIRNLEYPEESFDILIAAFCIPFLYDEETVDFIRTISTIVKQNGYIYLSTMRGSGNGFETPSFSVSDKFFFNYYSEEFLKKHFAGNGLYIRHYFIQDYKNKDGSILKDMIFILQKCDGDIKT